MTSISIHPTQSAVRTPARVWIGRVLSGIATAFMLFDGLFKIPKPTAVVQAMAQLGYPEHLAVGIGVIALACTIVYAIPRTAVFGAVLLTGYLGGAIASQIRIQAPAFNLVFPLILAAFIWGGLYLRDARVRALVGSR